MSANFRVSDLVTFATTPQTTATKRDYFCEHYVRRDELIQVLRNDPRELASFRVEVKKLERLRFPPLKKDDANAWMWRYEFSVGLLEMPTVEFIVSLIRQDSCLVDGGAHVGYFTDVFIRAGACPNRIVAIEAHPNNADILRANLQSRGAHILEYALGDKNKIVPFYDGTGHSNSSLIEGGAARGYSYEVQMRTLDSIVSELQLGSLAILKLDVEGAEPLVIEGCHELIKRSHDLVMIVESNPSILSRAGSSPTKLMSQVGRLGFQGRVLGDDFTIGPPGVVRSDETVNVAFARPERWRMILEDFPSASLRD